MDDIHCGCREKLHTPEAIRQIIKSIWRTAFHINIVDLANKMPNSKPNTLTKHAYTPRPNVNTQQSTVQHSNTASTRPANWNIKPNANTIAINYQRN